MSEICVVCCVEAGPLEVGARRLVESVRRFGGQLGQAHIVAVTPRFGPDLTAQTKEVFSNSEVEHVRARGTRYAWNNFMNKPLALIQASQRTQAELMVWLDSDVLVLQEPRELIDYGRQGFAACAPYKTLGSTGPEDPHDAYWAQVCQAVGLDLEAMPMIQTEKEKAWIRLYINSGVFAYPRESGLAGAFWEDCDRVLQAGVSSRESGIFFTDQVVVGLSALRLGLVFQQLSYGANYDVGSTEGRIENMQDPYMAQVQLVHYHDAMWPGVWPRFLDSLHASHPEVGRWLEPLGPMHNPLTGPGKLLTKALKMSRQLRTRRFQTRCTDF